MQAPTPDAPKSLAPAMARRALGGALYTVGSQAVRFTLSVLTTVVVARILSPDDYGVVAMWAPFFALVLLFQDFGFSTAAIQSKSLSGGQSTTLFWSNVLASLGIGFLLIISAQFVGRFYGDSRVTAITAASAAMVFVGGLSIQHTALLNRQMRFGTLAVIGAASAITNAVATVSLALYLRSYWALFFGNLASVLITTILAWSLCEWRPGRRASLEETRELLGFGAHVAAFNLVNFLSRNADNILIGKVWGAGPLGLYDRSYKLLLTPLQFINAPLSRVTLPVLSQLREEPERYRNAYLFCFQAILLATAPIASVCVGESDKVILLLLGPRWSGAAPIFFWLSLVMVYQPASNSLGLLFLSCNRSRAYAVWGIFSGVVTVTSFVIGLPNGAAGVAKAYFVANLAIVSVLIIVATRGSPVKVKDLLGTLIPTLVCSVFSVLMVRWVDQYLAALPLILVSTVASYLVALLGVWMSPQGRKFFAQLSKHAKPGAA